MMKENDQTNKSKRIEIKRLQLCILIASVAAAALLSSFVVDYSSYQMGFLRGLLICMGFLIVKTLMVIKNNKKLDRKYIQENDERNIYIERVASQFTFFVSVIGMAFVSFIFSFFNQTVALSLGLSSVAIVFVYLVSLVIAQKKI
jgi:uncharacterized membrane protein